MSNISIVCDDGNLCGEGPIWNGATQELFWTDCAGKKFYSLKWGSGKRAVELEDFEVNGCALSESGGFVFVNNDGVWSWDRRSEPQLIVRELGHAKLQLNDCVVDPAGRLLAGSCFYAPTASYQLGKLFSLDADGKIQILDEGFHLANGLGFSPDGKTLYFSDSVVRMIYEYEYDVVSGAIGERQIFAEIPESSGLPDGLTVDAEGFVWSAEWYGSQITRYDPDGDVERRIAVPAKQTSSLTFGGPGLSDIFVTSAARSEPMPVMPSGYDAANGYFGGALFHLNEGIQGRPEYSTKIKPKAGK